MKDFDRRLTEIIEEIRRDSKKSPKPGPPVPEKDRPDKTSTDDKLSSLTAGFSSSRGASKPGEPPPADPPRQEEFLSRFGRYYLLENLGFGNMAETFKTRRIDEKDGKHLILKRFRIESPAEDMTRLFLEDVKRVSRFRHPHIVAVTDFGKLNNFLYLVKEYVDGMDLGSIAGLLCRRNRRIPFPILAFIGIRICDALAAAGEFRDDQRGEPRALVHGNIVPSNIFVSFEGEVKLADFSLFRTAKMLHPSRPGLLSKKISYLSPEQARGEEIDTRADIYALGAVLYEMAGGEPVFPKESGLSLVNKILNGQVIPVFSADFEAPEIFKEAVLKSLRYEPGKRHASVDEFRQELKRSLQEESAKPFEDGEAARFMTEGLDETSSYLEEWEFSKPSPAEPSAPESPEPPVEPIEHAVQTEAEPEHQAQIPPDAGPDPASPSAAEAGLDVLPSRFRVVIGIQNALTQRIIKMAFTRDDFEIEVVADGREVLETALRMKADAVIIEIDLPHIDGYDLCDTIKRSSDLRETKVLMIRKEFEKVDEDRLNRLPFDLLVQMPVKSRDLVEKALQLLRGTAPPDSGEP